MRTLTLAFVVVAACGRPRPAAPVPPPRYERWTALCVRHLEQVRREEPRLARATIVRRDGAVDLAMPLDTCGEGIHVSVWRSPSGEPGEVPWERMSSGTEGWRRQGVAGGGSIGGLLYRLYLGDDAERVEGVLKRAVDECIALD